MDFNCHDLFLLFQHAFRDGRLEEVVLRHLGAEDGNTVIAKDIRSAIVFVPFYHCLFSFSHIIWLQLHSNAIFFTYKFLVFPGFQIFLVGCVCRQSVLPNHLNVSSEFHILSPTFVALFSELNLSFCSMDKSIMLSYLYFFF